MKLKIKESCDCSKCRRHYDEGELVDGVMGELGYHVMSPGYATGFVSHVCHLSALFVGPADPSEKESIEKRAKHFPGNSDLLEFSFYDTAFREAAERAAGTQQVALTSELDAEFNRGLKYGLISGVVVGFAIAPLGWLLIYLLTR